MVSWDDVSGGGGVSLLPEGTRQYEVTIARAEINEHTGRRQALLSLTSSAGAGDETIPLESWGDEDLFHRIFGSQAKGLGFKPSRADFDANRAICQADIDEFTERHLPTLIGATVEAKVEHKPSKTLKDDGTPFINHRVYFNKLVTPGQQQLVAAGVGASEEAEEFDF